MNNSVNQNKNVICGMILHSQIQHPDLAFVEFKGNAKVTKMNE